MIYAAFFLSKNEEADPEAEGRTGRLTERHVSAHAHTAGRGQSTDAARAARRQGPAALGTWGRLDVMRKVRK